jgi:hypothetical protein
METHQSAALLLYCARECEALFGKLAAAIESGSWEGEEGGAQGGKKKPGRPRKVKKERAKRKPSAFNKFMKDTLATLRETNAGSSDKSNNGAHAVDCSSHCAASSLQQDLTLSCGAPRPVRRGGREVEGHACRREGRLHLCVQAGAGAHAAGQGGQTVEQQGGYCMCSSLSYLTTSMQLRTGARTCAGQGSEMCLERAVPCAQALAEAGEHAMPDVPELAAEEDDEEEDDEDDEDAEADVVGACAD